MRERKDFDLAALFDWSVFAATRDSGEIFKRATFEILPPDQWPARKRSPVESFETTTATTWNGEARTTVRVRFTPRSSHYDRAGFLEVIDRLTSRFDEEEAIELKTGQLRFPVS